MCNKSLLLQKLSEIKFFLSGGKMCYHVDREVLNNGDTNKK
jgi:hypothetical protein